MSELQSGRVRDRLAPEPHVEEDRAERRTREHGLDPAEHGARAGIARASNQAFHQVDQHDHRPPLIGADLTAVQGRQGDGKRGYLEPEQPGTGSQRGEPKLPREPQYDQRTEEPDDQPAQQGFGHVGQNYRRGLSGFPLGLRDLIIDMLSQARRLRLQQAAASLAFLSLLAAVPIVSIALAVLAALPLFGRLRDDLQSFLYSNLFPEAFNQTVIERLNEFAERASSLSSISALVFFLTAIAALRVIERTMNLIWNVRSRRSFARRLGLYWVLLTLGPLLLAATVGLSTELIADTLQKIGAPALRSAWFGAAPWLTGATVIWLLFMTLPATRVNGWHALAGTLLSVLIIAALQRALTAYVRQLPTYEVVYGAFAALPLFLIWLFAIWIAFLLGALLAANLRHWGRSLKRQQPECAGQSFADARIVLRALLQVSAGRVEAALAVSQLREAFAGDGERVEATGLLLEETRYIIRYLPLAEIEAARGARPAHRLVGGPGDIWLERWAWREDPSALTLRPLFDRLWWGSQDRSVASEASGLPEDFLDRSLSAGWGRLPRSPVAQIGVFHGG